MRAILIVKGKEPQIIPELKNVDFETFKGACIDSHKKLDLVVLEPTNEEIDEDLVNTEVFEEWLTLFDDLTRDSVFDMFGNVVVF